jgi:hypothetical protein
MPKLVLFSLLIMFASRAAGQTPRLQWSADTLQFNHSGCEYINQTTSTYIYNPNDVPIMLTKLSGATYTVTNWQDIRGDVLEPGDSVEVKLGFENKSLEATYHLLLGYDSDPDDTLVIKSTDSVAWLESNQPDTTRMTYEVGGVYQGYLTYEHHGTVPQYPLS